MRDGVYKKDFNRIKVTGEVHNLPEYVRGIQTEEGVRPLVSFDLYCYRPKKEGETESKYDDLKIVVFDYQDLLEDVKEGMRIEVNGEMQSRNYNRVNEEAPDELYIFAVQNYKAITGKYPTEIQPDSRKKQPVDWRKLMELGGGLIPGAPEDSMFDSDMVKNKSQETPFIYMVDEFGELTKETQHVTYEIVAVEKPIILKEEFDPIVGDVNAAKFCGTVTKDPFFNLLGSEKPVPFVNFNVGAKSEYFEDHMFFINAIAWGKNAEAILQDVHAGDVVFFKGRVQCRPYVKKFRKRWVTPGGNRKHKDIELPLKTREISISYIEKRNNKK